MITVDGTFPPVRLVSAPYRIKQEACQEFGIKMADLMGKRATNWIVRARRKAARRMRVELHMSYPDIGRLLNRHHTSIMSLLSKAHDVVHTARKEDAP